MKKLLMVLSVVGLLFGTTAPQGLAISKPGSGDVAITRRPGVLVSLSPLNPAAGSIITSASSTSVRNPVLAVNLTAYPTSDVVVNDITFTKSNKFTSKPVFGAYIEENERVIATHTAIDGDKITFENVSIKLQAGQTRTIFLTVDPVIGLSAGMTTRFSIASRSDITVLDPNAVELSSAGIFPIAGNLFTIVSVTNPPLATFQAFPSSIGSVVTAGTNDNLVGAWHFDVTQSPLRLRMINFSVVGSANPADIRNVRLFISGVQAGVTLASVDMHGNTFFDLRSAPPSLLTGSQSVQIIADIAGSTGKNFSFVLANDYDTFVADSSYNIPVRGQSSSGTTVNIVPGGITVQRAPNSPTGSIQAGQSQVVLARFIVSNQTGDGVKVNWLGWGLNFIGASSSIDNQMKNVQLVDDTTGGLIATVATLSTPVTCTDFPYSSNPSSYRNCFGSSSSHLNYIIPPATTRTLSLKADIPVMADFSFVQGLLTGNTNNAVGILSSYVFSTGSAAANTLFLTH